MRLSRAVSGPGEATRVAGSGVRGVELGDVGLQTFAGPTSVLQSTAIASSAAASVASQSPGWANTSNLAPVLVFFVVEESGTSAGQKCRANTEAIAPINLLFTLAGAVSCGQRGGLSGPARIVTPLLVAACDFKKIKKCI